MDDKILNFSIFKSKDATGTKPTHYLSAKVGNGYVVIGSAWTKDSANGKYLSCKLNTPYKGKQGYSIASYQEDEYIPDPELVDEIEKAKKAQQTDDLINNVDSIPF